MKHAPKPTPIGLDSTFAEVFPGDEVTDAGGVVYTILDNGWARPLTGGNEVAFRRLKEPIISRKAVFAVASDGRIGPVVRSAVPAPDVLMKDGTITIDLRRAEKEMDARLREPIKEHPHIDPASPAAIKKTTQARKPHAGGRKNRSGVSKINPICHKLGISGRGVSGYLRERGFDVFRSQQTSVVRTEDRDRVIAFLRDNPPPVGIGKTNSWDIRRSKGSEARPWKSKATAKAPKQEIGSGPMLVKGPEQFDHAARLRCEAYRESLRKVCEAVEAYVMGGMLRSQLLNVVRDARALLEK